MGIIRRCFNATVGAVSNSKEVRISAEEELEELGSSSFSYARSYQTTEYGRKVEFYRPLLAAAMSGMWENAEDFVNKNPGSVEVAITVCGRTALHIAAGAAHSEFVLHLIKMMSIEALELKDSYDGNTALHLAVIAGLDEAVKAMVKKHRLLTRKCNRKGLNPLLNAAIHVNKKHKEIIRFLCGVMKDEPKSFEGHSGAQLICSITHAGLYDLATTLIREHPSLATAREEDGNSTALYAIAEKDLSIPIAYEESILSLLTYHRLCEISEKPSIFLKVLFCFDCRSKDEDILTTRIIESNGGNILHVAAKIAPPSRLNIYSSPVAQMQSEIIWFKKVKKRVPRGLRNMRNKDGETPEEVFTREHKDLMKKAEAYMIRTAESCLVVAALVATVAFAAAITLPGGTFSDGTDTTEKGKPVLLRKQSFLVFMVADALALFSSTTAILLFLSIYIGNHNEGNFELILPRTLKRGLGSLILSVLSVVTAFSMAISIILKDKYIWAPYLIFAVAAFTFYISLNRPFKLIFELDDIEKPLYWTTSRDHQPDVPLPLQNV
ncbi:ankyrin repeat-containing protein NPR4-like [Papaver somniferum]|uniref:ankyrin repeat-containing protein NPR4-like n=1 Tax=Papaver somniferum TaxID=3469 RepID=UPI000E705007|nr:ankyrin repeat-containing protein NPR4-like [Papaver somniferum]